MRFGGRRLLAALMLYVLVLFGLPACSGDQQQDEAVGASDDNGSGDAGGSGDNQAAGDDNSGNDNAGGDDNTASSDDSGGGNTADVGSGNSTENDLQDIIQEMNGQGSGDTAGSGSNAAPLAQETPAADAPASAPAASNAAAPANAAKSTAQAEAKPAAETAAPPPFQPGGTSAGKGLPEIGSKMIYVVQKGDTLAKISSKIYGSGNRWNELATLSQLPNPSRIFPGDLIYYTLDETAVPFATAYEAVQRSEEQVKQGDTLATIAKRVYGNPNAWRAIWRENDKIDNPDVIPPGSTVYYVAQGAATAALHKVQAQMATFAKALTTKNHTKNLTTNRSAFKGSPAAAKNNLISAKAKLAKHPGTLLAASQTRYSGFSADKLSTSALN